MSRPWVVWAAFLLAHAVVAAAGWLLPSQPMGDVVLVNERTSFGVGLGVNAIDGVYFAVIRPDVNLQFGKFELGLGAPLEGAARRPEDCRGDLPAA